MFRFSLFRSSLFLLACIFGANGYADECQTNAFSASELTVLDAYVAYYGRPADSAGLDFWAGKLDQENGNLDAIIAAFGTSPEFEARFGNLSNTELVENIYQQLFNRAPDQAGLNFYVGELDSQFRTLQSIALDVLNGAQNDDLLILQNKRAVITDYYVSSNQLGVGLSDTELADSLAGVGSAATEAETTCTAITAQLNEICSQSDACQSTLQTNYEVLVIGGGVSGLKAAKDLTAAGFEVLVLEAQDKIGGRTRTDRSLGIAFDEGASWIHGAGTNNPIAQISDAAGLDTFRTNDDNSELYDADGNSVSGTLEDRQYELYEAALEQVRGAGTVEQSFKTVYDSFSFTQLNATPQLRDYMLSAYLEFDIGGDITKLSSSQFDDDEAFAGAEQFVTNGYDTLATYLHESGEFEVRLNQRVSAIDYASEGGTVSTTDDQSYTAGAVVVTVPLGVLKAGAITFTPDLPSSHSQAVSRMGMGNVNKFLLNWDANSAPFWDLDVHYIGYTSPTKGLFNYFLNLKPITGLQANALMTFAFGDQADASEALSDQQVIDAVMANLQAIYGDNIPAPSALLRTKWRANENSFGAYSYAAQGSPSSDFDDLAEPINDTLFFAGEHTLSAYRATVHGAYLSGKAVAERVIEVM